jgi:hypothetical protein
MHTAQSISILSTLATHGAVALRNANDFKRANAALEKAEQARAELERHVRSIQAAAEAHEQMTSLLAKGPRWRRCARRSPDSSAAACWCSTRPVK